MEGPLGIAIAALLVIGICIQLAVALRNRYIKVYSDVEKDEESYATELELQLQSELDEAIKSSTPLVTPDKGHFDVVIQTYAAPHIRFVDETNSESSWTAFKRESRAKLQQLAKTLMILSKDDVSTEEESSNIYLDSPQGYIKAPPGETRRQRSVRRQLPLLDSEGALAERAVLVNAKQYSRILKRRLARQLMEEYFRSNTKPKSPVSPHTGSMHRPRGPGGRFLTTDELRQMEAGPLVHGTVA